MLGACSQSGGLFAGPGSLRLACIALAPAPTTAPSGWLEATWPKWRATMTWKAPPNGSYLQARGAQVAVTRDTDAFRILSKCTG